MLGSRIYSVGQRISRPRAAKTRFTNRYSIVTYFDVKSASIVQRNSIDFHTKIGCIDFGIENFAFRYRFDIKLTSIRYIIDISLVVTNRCSFDIELKNFRYRNRYTQFLYENRWNFVAKSMPILYRNM